MLKYKDGCLFTKRSYVKQLPFGMARSVSILTLPPHPGWLTEGARRVCGQPAVSLETVPPQTPCVRSWGCASVSATGLGVLSAGGGERVAASRNDTKELPEEIPESLKYIFQEDVGEHGGRNPVDRDPRLEASDPGKEASQPVKVWAHHHSPKYHPFCPLLQGEGKNQRIQQEEG